jgi:hypothetical protein
MVGFVMTTSPESVKSSQEDEEIPDQADDNIQDITTTNTAS